VVVVVDSAFDGQVGWGYPFAGAIGQFAGAPAAFFDEVTCSRFPGRLVLGVHAAVLVVV
jgi:hypothetical protein